MRKIPTTYGLSFFLEELEYTEAALAADPDAAELARAFEEGIGEWEGTFKKERAARRAVTRSEAVVAVRNAQIDRLTMTLGGMAKAHDPSGALVRRFFGSVSPSRYVAQALRRQCEKTRDVVLAEIDKLEAQHPLRAYRAPLATGLEAALVALDGRNKAKGDRQTSTNDVDEWKDGVNKLRTTTYAELLKIAVGKGYARSWADTFFRTDEAPDRPAMGDEAEAPSPAPAPGA